MPNSSDMQPQPRLQTETAREYSILETYRILSSAEKLLFEDFLLALTRKSNLKCRRAFDNALEAEE